MATKEEDDESLMRQFCGYTTAHGLGRFGAQTGAIGRGLWICFLLGTYGGFTFHMYSLGQQFAAVPLRTSLSTSLPFEFPDVYFCPTDLVTMSRASPQVNIKELTRALTCDTDCKKQLKFDIHWSPESGTTSAAQYGPAAQGLLHVISAVESNISQSLHYGKNTSVSTCRTTLGGEEYIGNLSIVHLFGTAQVREPVSDINNLPKIAPYLSTANCIGWNSAARELQAAGVPLAAQILAMGYSEDDSKCRQPRGLPLKSFQDNSTHQMHLYVGCLDKNASAADFPHLCLQDPYGWMNHERCAECCYVANYTYMALHGDQCLCGEEVSNVTALSLSDFACSRKCRGNIAEACGGDAAAIVYQVRSSGSNPLFIPFRASIDSFNEGPYCFYRGNSGQLSATYCNVPFCPISPGFDCLALNSEDQVSSGEYLRYTGYKSLTNTKDSCIDWTAMRQALLNGSRTFRFDAEPSILTVNILDVYIETPDFELYTNGRKANNFCRAARVLLDAAVTEQKTGRHYFIRTTIVDTAKPVCPISITNDEILLSSCSIDACSRKTKSIPGLVRDRIGSALLASRFSSSMGIGFTGCTFGEHLCTIDDFTTVFHPEFGVCHRFNQEKWVQQSKDVKATDSTLTVSYFTDATDSLGQQLPGIDRMSRVVFPGVENPNDDSFSAMQVVVVPVGQFPWRDKALTASPGQHLELRMRYDKVNRFSKPPDQACNQSKNDVTYRLPSWQSSWRYTPQALQSVNITELKNTADWAKKTKILESILMSLNASISEMNQTIHFSRATRRDCVNTYAVHKFIRHCGCLPSFLPIPVEFFPTYNYCFDDKTDLLSIESTEACYMRLMASISRYEMEARQLCLDMCERRSYAIRPVTYPWPGLTIDSATDFLHNSLGDWSYPYNFLFSKGVANLFYMDIRTKEVQARRSNLSANEMLEFTNELQNVERSLAKISIQALSDFGQEMTEEPSYTTKNLMADLGGALGLWSGISVLTVCELIELLVYAILTARQRIAAKKRISQEAAHRAEVAAGKPEPSRSPVHGEEFEISQLKNENESG
ncbi:hypothetical protein BOX15_Mlig007204g1 [Macrostomum lignano]|uniref:WSC domain-containing protein n=4 Tax=Macrostomum lignano TaxID=282301 RepID=A0A267GC91_9PLAT|nr:hypothetical protein BOX15_Mlig007204g1 [Macrostomum lignano]